MAQPEQNAAISYAFKLLGRLRSKAERKPGASLKNSLDALRQTWQNSFIEIMMADGSIGRLLVQHGHVVSAQHGDDISEVAFRKILTTANESQLYILGLDEEQTAFACAALAGTIQALAEEFSPDSHKDAETLLNALSKDGFGGIVALEQGMRLLIWRFQEGKALNENPSLDSTRARRFTQIAWQQSILPELLVSASSSVPPKPSVSPTQTLAGSSPRQKPSSTASSPASAAPSAPTSARESPNVWLAFEKAMRESLGNRSIRVVKIMQDELSGLSGAELTDRLAKHLERVAGAREAQSFRDSI